MLGTPCTGCWPSTTRYASAATRCATPTPLVPQLHATKPNELWSWDITKLYGPAKWTYFSLYVVLDVFSRYVVGWRVAHRESATLAQKLLAQTCERQVDAWLAARRRS